MTFPALLHGSLATHRRGKVLQEALSAVSCIALPVGRAAILTFADDFQAADDGEQTELIEWTRASGHLLLLLPPFAPPTCLRPVSWRAERIAAAPLGGEGLARVLAPEVGYRLSGKLQFPALSSATWSDLSAAVGTYRLHPAAGLVAVTCLPLWSLAVLDAPEDLESWFTSLFSLAGDSQPAKPSATTALSPDHYGLLVFLLSEAFTDEAQVLAGLRSSSIFRISPEKGRLLLNELRERGLLNGAVPTSEASKLVMQSPYAAYVSALREVSNQ